MYPIRIYSMWGAGGEERGVNIDGDNRVDCSLVVAYVGY